MLHLSVQTSDEDTIKHYALKLLTPLVTLVGDDNDGNGVVFMFN